MKKRQLTLSRRTVLTGGLNAGLSATLLSASGIASAHQGTSQTPPKLIVIILRGAMDGLGAVPVIGAGAGGEALRRYRKDLISARAVPVFEGFALHPALKNMSRYAASGQARILHAASGPYRERSHFLAQDLLESGTGRLMTKDGWLNRALRNAPSALQAVAIGSATPHIVKGGAPVTSWSPATLPQASEDTAARLLKLYEADPALESALAQSLALSKTVGDGGGARSGARAAKGNFVALATAAGRLIGAAGGPDIGVLSLTGWDTHVNQVNSLERQLSKLDAALGALETTLGTYWNSALITVVTEFGRTVRQNGTLGTDHGTGGAAFVLGGALKGRGLIGDWPGLESSQLYENRDVFPVNDLRGLFMAALHQQFGFSYRALEKTIFPRSSGLPRFTL